MKVITLLIALVLSGCASQAGVHYEIKYGDIEVSVTDYTDREGVMFTYVKDGTEISLKKDSVDTTTPGVALGEIQAKNQAELIGIVKALVD